MAKSRFSEIAELADFDATPQRVAATRQLCPGSNRELYEEPRNSRCPVCERKVDVTRRYSGRRDPQTGDEIDVWITPSHMMPRLT